MLEHFDALHAVAGLLVGILVGLTGVGGGSLMTPMLVLIFGINPGTAVGTDLLFASLTKVVGSAVHGKRDSVDWRIVGRLAMGSVPAAVVTLLVISSWGRPPASASKIMLLVLGVMLILTSLATLFQKQIAAFAQRNESEGAAAARAPWATVLLGVLLGVAVTLSSVGAGAIGVTALLLLYPGLRIARIVGSDIAHAVPLTLVAGFGHWIIGDVNLLLLGALLLGSIPGVIIGSLLSTRAPDRILRPALAAVLLVSGIKLLS
ncbi:sulfite exporter TauE/SafE family protein [Novosphingobium sp. SG720]|uniref:sulfite exporter TauE/SafE family protein n=1 Tax=Novosphingobium sp. SG720 TaxID=2586998 RepID=UPI001444B7D0|nr:sulfite exporter TauE/SafE family protein [Novosphingobium sp. SG720]NKJ43636.1 hypothetical protein [Novosphingobium sp. SG720]